MIFHGTQKTKQVYDGEQRVYMIFHGEDLIFNCYILLNRDVVFIREDGMADINLKSNTEWSL